MVIITSNQHSICCYFNIICVFMSRFPSGFFKFCVPTNIVHVKCSYCMKHLFSYAVTETEQLVVHCVTVSLISAAEPLPLMDLCRRVIRQRIGKHQLEERITNLNLPQPMKVYLLYQDRR